MTHTHLLQPLPAAESAMSRRRFLLLGLAFSASGAVLAAQRLPVVPAAAPPPLDLVRSTFAAHLGEVFLFERDSGGPVALTLVDVRDLAFPASDPQQSFSILFRGPAAELLPQDTYRMWHYRIGSHMLFIVPRPSDRHPAAYEAVFNRLPA
jgi:hypothetical protein